MSDHDEQLAVDSLGFARPTRRRETPVCLDLMGHLSDQMQAEGLVGAETIPELRCRYREVLDGLKPCPLAGTCEKYQRALKRGAKLVHSEPAQLKLL